MMHPADPHQLVGTRLGGRYWIDAQVDETALSIVYRATHLVWRRSVAIKVFKGVTGLGEKARAELLASFVREGALLGELSEVCSAVCQARDVGSLTTADGRWMPYMVLEWLDGTALDLVLARERGSLPRTVEQTVRVLSPIAEALACAHARGVIHRDVKPGNIVLLGGSLDGEARCKLVDFGIAKVAGEGASVASNLVERAFTPSYGAPEQFDPSYGLTGPWTDIYALALVAVEMVCGCEPLKGDDVASLQRCSCDPGRRPSPRALGVEVGDQVERVLQHAVALFPCDRFQDMRAFWTELTSAACPAAEPRRKASYPLDATVAFDLRRLRARERVTPRVAVRKGRRHPWPAAVLTATVVLALAIGADSGASRTAQSERGPDPNAPAVAKRHVSRPLPVQHSGPARPN
jgi:serine/threonine protein kinase